MSLVWKPGYSPPFPSSPTNGQVFVDPNTGISWTYNSATSTWAET